MNMTTIKWVGNMKNTTEGTRQFDSTPVSNFRKRYKLIVTWNRLNRLYKLCMHYKKITKAAVKDLEWKNILPSHFFPLNFTKCLTNLNNVMFKFQKMACSQIWWLPLPGSAKYRAWADKRKNWAERWQDNSCLQWKMWNQLFPFNNTPVNIYTIYTISRAHTDR